MLENHHNSQWTIEERDVERLTADVCPSLPIFRLLGGHWTSPIIYQLQKAGPRRPGDLERAVHGISRKELHRRLDELVEVGIVERVVFAEVPPRVEYGLTERGRELVPAIKAISDWAVRNATKDAGRVPRV